MVVLQYCRTSDSKRCFIYNEDLGSVSKCEYQEADILEEFLERRISFRLQVSIPILLGKDQNGMLSFIYFLICLFVCLFIYFLTNKNDSRF